jgi:mRNA interferase MazF
MVDYVPDRGDAIWITLNPQEGHEQAGRRPAIVLTVKAYNEKSGLAICCPITNQTKGYPYEVAIPDGLGVTGVVLADQVRSLDWRERRAELIVALPIEVISDVREKLHTLLSRLG